MVTGGLFPTKRGPQIRATGQVHEATVEISIFSGPKKEPKPKPLGPEVFWWVGTRGGLPRGGVGAEKVRYATVETQGELVETTLTGSPGITTAISQGYPQK